MVHLPATIKARFYLAMGVMAILILGVGLTAVTIFNWFGRSTERALQTNVPAIENGYRAAARAHTIANAIQAFANTSSPTRLDHQYRQLSASLDRLLLQVEDLADDETGSVVGDLRSQAGALSGRLQNIHEGRLLEISGERRRTEIARQSNELLRHINEEIEPIKNNAGFELNIALYGMIQEGRAPTESLRQRFFESDLPNFQYSLEVEASAGQAHALLAQAFHETNPRAVQILRQNFEQVSEQLDLHIASFGPTAEIEQLAGYLNQLQSLGVDEGNLFERSLELLELRARTAKNVVAAMSDAAQLAAHAEALSHQLSRNVTSTADQLNSLNERGTIIVILLTAMGLILAGITAWVLVGRVVIDRLRHLRDLMDAGQKGVYIRDQIPLAGSDEISDICRALDYFLNRLEQDVDKLIASEKDVRAAKEKAEAALTELHTTQESLIQSEKLASIATLVAGVAHELNTPLGAAVGVVSHLNKKMEAFGETLDEGQLRKAEVKRFYDFVREGAQILRVNIDRTIELIQRFKQLSGNQPLDQKRLVNLSEFLAGCLADREIHLRDRHIDVSIYCPDDVDIMTHPVALSQILTTLIMNSLTHAFDADDTGFISIMANATVGGVNIVYEDNGSGMTEEQASKIFEPYQASLTDSHKTGLGMLLVHNIVTLRLGGKITVESRPGEGTKFEIHLPTEVRDRNAA